jgi:hypothetical protein
VTVDELKQVFDILRHISRHERSNCITGEAISELTGIDVRIIAEIVSAAASRGIRVASCSFGYYTPTNEEIQQYLAREKARLASLGRKVAGIKRYTGDTLTLWEQTDEEAA